MTTFDPALAAAAIVSPLLGEPVAAGGFFRVVGDAPQLLRWPPVAAFRRRQAGVGLYTYVALGQERVGLFELRWSPLRVERVVALVSIPELAAKRVDRNSMEAVINGRGMTLVAASPSTDDAGLVLDRLTIAASDG